MDRLFRNEKEAIEFIKLNIPIAVKPIRKAKTMLVNPFTSVNSRYITVDCLGKALYQFQEKKACATNKDL